jgi:hypothetical protein
VGTQIENPLAEGLNEYGCAEPALMVLFGATGEIMGEAGLPHGPPPAGVTFGGRSEVTTQTAGMNPAYLVRSGINSLPPGGRVRGGGPD